MTQQEKVLAYMIGASNQKDWFYPQDFMKPELSSQYFVGYTASSRMSEIMHKYPQMVEWKQAGKYRIMRFRKEDAHKFLPTLEPRIRSLVLQHMSIGGIKSEPCDFFEKNQNYKESICKNCMRYETEHFQKKQIELNTLF